MRDQLAYCLLFLTLLLVSCSNTEKTDVSEEQEKVRQVFNEFVKTVEAGDVDSYLTFVTDDFIGYDAGAPPMTNRDELKTMLTGFFAANTFKVSDYQSQEVIIRDDIAVHRHKGFITITPKNGADKIELKVKYLDVMRKNDKGEWKFYMHSVSPNSK